MAGARRQRPNAATIGVISAGKESVSTYTPPRCKEKGMCKKWKGDTFQWGMGRSAMVLSLGASKPQWGKLLVAKAKVYVCENSCSGALWLRLHLGGFATCQGLCSL